MELSGAVNIVVNSIHVGSMFTEQKPHFIIIYAIHNMKSIEKSHNNNYIHNNYKE